MRKRLPRAVIVAICVAILVLLLACEGTGPRTRYQICEDTENGRVCREEVLTRDQCLEKLPREICG